MSNRMNKKKYYTKIHIKIQHTTSTFSIAKVRLYMWCLITPTLRSHVPMARCQPHSSSITPPSSPLHPAKAGPSVYQACPKQAGGQPGIVTLPSQDVACWDGVPPLSPWHSSLTALYICLRRTPSADKEINTPSDCVLIKQFHANYTF